MNNPSEKIKLLLVDDEEEFLASTAAALKRRGFDIHTAGDGVSALKMIEKAVFDIVVLDIKMPGIDGAEVARRLSKEHQDLPVIILTAHGSIPQAFEASKDGVYDYLAKPCDIDLLVEKIKEAVRAHPVKKSSCRGEGISVMIVDDEEELLASMRTILERRRMIVTTAQSGPEALTLLSNTDTDVVILDIKMPEMDGLEVLQAIKKQFPAVEVILLTGHPDVDNALRGVKMGACEYLVKPPDLDDLLESIRKAFEMRRVQMDQQRQQNIRDILKKYPD